MMELVEKKSEMAGQIFLVVVLNDEALDEAVQLFGQEQGTAPPNKMEIFFQLSSRWDAVQSAMRKSTKTQNHGIRVTSSQKAFCSFLAL